MSLYEELQLSPRPAMTDPGYFLAVQVAASELRAAEPWLLVTSWGEPRLVARRRTAGMALVTWVLNLWRRPRRWYLERVRLAYELRQSKGNRNG